MSPPRAQPSFLSPPRGASSVASSQPGQVDSLGTKRLLNSHITLKEQLIKRRTCAKKKLPFLSGEVPDFLTFHNVSHFPGKSRDPPKPCLLLWWVLLG